MVGYLVRCLADWFISWLLHPSMYLSVHASILDSQSVSQLSNQSVCWLVFYFGLLIGQLFGWSISQSVGWLVCRLFSRLFSCKSIGPLIGYVENLFFFLLIGWYFDKLLIDCLIFWAGSR